MAPEEIGVRRSWGLEKFKQECAVGVKKSCRNAAILCFLNRPDNIMSKCLPLKFIAP